MSGSISIMLGNFEVIQYLVKRGASTNAKDVNDETPLHLCAYGKGGRFISVGECLLKAGSDPNAENQHGLKPLDIAASLNSLKFVEMLLRSGAHATDKLKRSKLPRPDSRPLRPVGNKSEGQREV